MRFAITALLLLATAVFLQWRGQLEKVPYARPLAMLPATMGAWRSADLPIAPDVRSVLGPGDFLDRWYSQNGARAGIDLFIGYFPSQRTGNTIHSPMNCLPGAGWEIVARRRVVLELPGSSKPLQINEILIANGSRRMYGIYWYQAHGRSVASEYTAKFYMAVDAIRTNRTDGAIVRFLTPLWPGESEDQARQRTLDLSARVVPLLPDYIPD